MDWPSSKLHPKTTLCLWGKFEGGLLTPSIQRRRFLTQGVRNDKLVGFFPLGEKAEILRYAQDDQTTVGSEKGLLPLPNIRRSFASLRMTGYENHFCLWGKVGKGVKPSFQNVSLRADFARSLLSIEGVRGSPSRPPNTNCVNFSLRSR